MAYQENWGEKGLCRVFSGDIACSEILHANISLHADSRFYELNYLINDFTQVSGFEASLMDVKSCIAIDNAASKSKSALKVAFVAQIESLQTCAHLYALKMETSSFECRIFDQIEEAYNWLCVKAPLPLNSAV